MIAKITTLLFACTFCLWANAQNVGIGTTNPTVNLDIKTDSAIGDAAQIRLNAPNLHPNIGAPISIGATVISQGKNNTIGNQAEWRFNFIGDNWFDNYQTFGFSGLDPVMTIRRTGSVGIGTTDPAFGSILTVAGNANFTGNVGIGVTNPVDKLHISYGNLFLNGSNIDFGLYGYKFWRISADDYNYKITDLMGSADRFYINRNSGNVGIGTTTPDAKLHIAGNIKIADGTEGAGKVLTSDADGLASWTTPSGGGLNNGAEAGNTPYWDGTAWVTDSSNIFNNGANVGIGTKIPAAKLDVAGKIKMTDGTQGTGKVLTSDANGMGSWATPTGLTGNGTAAGNTTYWNGTTWVNNSSNIFNNGNKVGIGTTTPSEKLSVAGTFTVNPVPEIAFFVPPWGNAGNNTVIGGVFQNTGSSYAGPQLRFGTDSISKFWDIGMNSTLGYTVEENDAPRLTIAPGGKMGIGTATPAAKLDISGNIKITDGTQGTGKVLTSDANGLASWAAPTNSSWGLTGNAGISAATHFLGTTDNHSLRIRTNNTEKMIVDSLGNVGIGTTTPTNKLSVSGNANFSGNVGIGTTSPAAKLDLSGNIKIADGTQGTGKVLTSDANGLAAWQAAPQNIEAGTAAGNTTFWNGTSWVTSSSNIFNNGGNVGIGTTSPSAKLDLLGNIKITDGTQGAGKVLTSDANGLAAWQAVPQNIGAGTAAGNTNYWNGTSWVTNSSNIFNNGGNVGIGNTTPANKLSVTGNTDFSGNVGIGTTSPGYKLTLGGGATDVMGVDNGASFVSKNSAGSYEQFLIPRWTDNKTILTYGTGGLNLRNNAFTNTMVLTDNNRVGIGTANPLDKLHIKTGNLVLDDGEQRFFVAGVAKWDIVGDNTAYYISRSGIDYPFYINMGSGNVGIGTTAPTAKLSVNGTANNTTGSWSLFSDARIKTINGDFTDGLNVISKIHTVKFNYNANAPLKADGEQIGIVAQELEKIAPYMVSQNQYKEIKDLREVNNQAYVFLLINAVKELNVQNEQLRAELDLIKSKLGLNNTQVNK